MPTKDEIKVAVADPEWQKFRVSLKGKTTQEKLDALNDYFWYEYAACKSTVAFIDLWIRVDNYLKSLARGGQLYPGVGLNQALLKDFQIPIRKVK